MEKNFNFLLTFSVLSQLLLIFNNSNSLYVAVSLSFIGFCVICYLHPYFFYNKYNWLLNTNLYIFNIICILIHFVPLYIYKNKQNLNKNNITFAVADTMLLLLIYDAIFKKYLENNLYPLNELELMTLSFIILFMILFYYKQIN